MRATSTLKKSFKSKESFKKSLITTAVAAAVALSSGFASAASDQPTLTEPVKAGSWSASLNRTDSGNYDINVFDQLVTGTGERTLNVEKTFSQTDFEAVKALDGFGEFGSYYDDDDINPYQVGMVDGVFINGADTDVTFNNASVVVTGGTLDGNPYVEIGGVYHREGAAEYTGASTNIHVSSAAAVDADEESWVYGYVVENPLGFAETQRRVTFSADKTDIAAESTNENGLDVIAFAVSTDAVDNPAVTFARGETTITASTANADMWAYALYMHNSDNNDGSGSVTVAEGATLNLVATGGNPTGLYIDHGTFTSNGTLIVRATTDEQEASPSAIVAAGNAQLIFNGKTEVYAQGAYGTALFVNSDYAGTVAASATFGPKSETTLNGALSVNRNCPVTLDGTMTVNGFVELIGSLTGSGNLTINGQRAEPENMPGSIFIYGSEVALNSLEITNDDVMNQSKISVAGTITLNDVLFENAEGDPEYDWPDAELQAAELVIGNAEFNNYGEVDVSGTVTLNEGAVVTNYKGFHSPSMVLNAGSRFIETYDLDDPEDAAEFNSGVIAIDGDLMQFSGGTLEAQSKDGQSMEITGIKLLPDPGSGPDDSMIRFTAGDYSFDTFEVDAPVFELGPRLQVEGGTLTLGTLELTRGDARVSGGALHADTVNAAGAFTMDVGSAGTFTAGKFVGAEGGTFTLASGTMQADELDLTNGLLSIADGATLATYSGEIFNPGLDADGTNPDAGSLIYGEDHLFFADGSTLAILDAKYNYDYRDSAQALLDGVNLTFKGELVNSSGEVQEGIDFGDVTEGDTLTQTDIVAPAPDGNGTVTVDKTVGGKTFVVSEGSSVAVSEGKTLTVVGSTEGGELVAFGEETGNSVSVSGGLALGSDQVDEATKGTISAQVNLAQGAKLSATNGEFSLAGVNAEGADIEVASGTLAADNLKLSGETSVAAALGAEASFKTVTADAGTHQFKGSITAESLTGSGKLLLGSAREGASASATLNVGTLTHTGIIFIDPAWTDNAKMEDGSFLTVQQLGEDGSLKADIVAGQHSTFVFGSTKDAAVKAFAETGLNYGRDDVSAVLYVAKPITVSEGSILVDGSLAELGAYAPTEGSVTIADNGLAMIDAKALEAGAAISADAVTFDEGSHIRVVNLTKDSEGVLVEANTLAIADDVIEDAKSTSAIVSLNLTKNEDGSLSYTTFVNDATVVFEDFEGVSLMNAMHEAGLNDVDASDRATRFLSRMAAYGDYGVGSVAQASEIGNEAMALAAAGGVYNVALDASKLMNRSIDARMSIKNGLVRGEGATVWADVLATTNEAESLYGDAGYDVDLYGGVLGADVGLGNGKMIGAALTVGTGDGGSKGAAFDIDNDADFVGLSVYGSHRLGDFNGKIDIGWMHTTSDLSATAFGMKLDDEVKADAWTVGIGGEYLFEMGAVNIVPHVGIRWTRLNVDGYEGAFRTDDDTMNIFTAPIGVAFSGNIDAGSWKLAPVVDLAVVPSFGDDEATSKVRWGSVKETIKTQVVDDAPFQASLGIDAQNGNWTIGASYDLGVGGDERLDNAFTLRALYAF